DLVPRIEKIARAKLSAADQLNYDLFLRNAKINVESQRFPDELMPLSQMGGVYNELSELARLSPHRNVADYENFLKRLAAYPKLIEQTIALMRQGLARGLTPPKVTLVNLGELIGNQISDDPTKTPLYQVELAKLPDSIPAADATRLQAAAKRVIGEQVMPAMRALHKYVVDEYVPHARQTIGLSALPDGAAWYAFDARVSTTTDLSPDRIHQIGLDEVTRIHGEMDKAMRATGWKGTMPEFFHYLHTDPKFVYGDRESLLAGYRVIAKRIDPGLPHLFGKLPRLTYGVTPTPAESEKTQPAAYYYPGSPEAGRAGEFYANLYDLKSRMKWEMEALTLHEAVPGHHLQIALAQEAGELPKFRQNGGYTAFVEGWGLYAESLGSELGMYADPYSKVGQLSFELWRAIRLVVDTGIHSEGWTREQAIDYFRNNSARPLHDIEVEVDRYIVWPGQALAYKIGQLKIRELRTLAEQRLGARFDVRAFHDVVLGGGALPLEALETRVKAWIDATAAAKK
ncbi:MAG TPA: DUF885 family protein, partial [Polyangia bacterium]|nr:DUF885 family protein [Polyangia bacterium]